MSKTLNESRFAAALATGGTSSKAVYDMTMSWLARLGCGGDLLEFGAGTGNLLHLLETVSRSSSLTGADILKRPNDLSSSIKWVETDLNYAVPLSDKFFDTIISTEVIEHLENPRAMVREFRRLLRPGGRIVITTPNQESWRSLLSLIIRGHFVLFLDSCYPAHITALVQKDLERILKEAGFGSIEFDFSNHGGIPARPKTTWQSSSFNLLKGRRFSDNILVTALAVS